MSWAMAEVYGAVTDQILINMAHYFPLYKPGQQTPGSFEYQARMLAQVGQVNRDTVDIIMKRLTGVDEALRSSLEAAITDALKTEEPKLRQAVAKGMLQPAGFLPPEVTPNQMQAFKAYYEQSADRLNLVNTVMLESTEAAYRATVSDVVQRVQNIQRTLNVGTGEVVTGVSTWNQALQGAVRKMVDNGITGLVDHGGHHWAPETYVAMDIRTTMFNVAREAIWERAETFGSDLYQVSSHNGARPLCYPWQGKVISRSDMVREVEDRDGNKIHVHAQSETSYGQPAGLFGINCKHYPMTFIPGISTIRGEPQDPEENERSYAESQEQRALERKLREEKRDLEVLKAQGASEDEIRAQRDRVRQASADIDAFCDKTGRARRRNREYTPINAAFPDKDSYDPSDFSTTQRDRINDWYKNGGRDDKPPQNPTNIHINPDNNPPTQAQVPIQQPKREALNVFGEKINFSEKMEDQKWDKARRRIESLTTEFNTKLKEVAVGSEKSAGSVQISGTKMFLSSNAEHVAIHEFAHSISMHNQTKLGLYEESAFWKEITAVRTSYKKSLKNDTAKRISTYANTAGFKDIDEFMAEAFTLAYMREKEIEIPHKYGEETVFSSKVLEITRKYFGKGR